MIAGQEREIQIKYLQAQWQENLGVDLAWETMEWAAFLDRLYKEPSHMHLHGWLADYPDPDSFLRVGASDIQLQTGWRNEAYDRLVEKARRVMDQGERMKLYAQADRILVESATIMPLIHERLHLLVKPWVRKPATPAIGGPLWKDVIIEPH